jgi:hypothetical protein
MSTSPDQTHRPSSEGDYLPGIMFFVGCVLFIYGWQYIPHFFQDPTVYSGYLSPVGLLMILFGILIAIEGRNKTD